MVGKILEGPKLNDVPKSSLGQFFFEAATKFHDRTCQIDANTDQHESFLNVKQRSIRVALEMQKRGITSEDVVVVCSSATLDALIPIVASFYLGSTVANLDPCQSIKEVTHLLPLVSPKMIFVQDSAVDLIERSLKGAGLSTEIVVIGKSSQYSTFSDFKKPQVYEDKFRPTEVDIHDPIIIFFSSGTTGLPKGICHSHYSFLNLVFTFYQSSLKMETILALTAFSWISGMMLLMCSFIGGGRRIVCANVEAENTFRIIQKYKVTYMFLAPILTYILTEFANYTDFDTSSLYSMLIGGTPVGPAQFMKLKSVFPHTNILVTYGLTECGVLSVRNPATDAEKLGSSGKICAGFKIKVVDPETNEVLGLQDKGEILIKSPSLMIGYYKVDSTNLFEEDGFIRSGDTGYYDEDGYVYVVGRIKEIFKYLSCPIMPSFIEDVLLEHPAVKDAIVFGLPQDVKVGELPAACVVLNEGSTVSEQELQEFVASQLTDWEKLRGGVLFWKELPRTTTGKLMRREIQASAIAALSGNK